MQRKIWRYLAAYLLPLGCVEQTWEAAVPHLTDASTTTSDTTTGSLPTTTANDPGDPVQTATSASEESSTTSVGSSSSSTATETTGGPAVNESPTIEDFWADPDQLSEAGKSQLHLKMSADVVKVRLYQNDDLLGVLTPDQFPYTYEALSAKYNLNHHFVVEVEDAEGLTAMDDLWLNVLLPKSGDERCIFKDQNMGAESSSIAALAYAEDAIVAVGWRNTGAGQRMAVWKLGKATCEVLDGWPRTISNWNPELAMETSRAVGVAIDENGYIALAANLWNGGPQPYVALLTPEGARIWEHLGDVGEETAGIAAGPQDRVFVGGARRTSENPIHTDAMVWGYQRFDNDQVVVWEDSLKAPLTPDEQEADVENFYSERAHAVIVWNGEVFVVGEREFKGDVFEVYTRTFTVRYALYGARLDPIWTSPGDYLKHEAMTGFAQCGAHLIAGGWSRDKFQDSLPVPLMRWIEVDGTSVEFHGEPLPSTQTFGIACDREEKIVSGGTRWSNQFDAHVFASTDPKKPPIIYDTGDASQDGVLALACDAEEGFCAGGGFRSAGLSFAVVRVYHP